MSQLWSQLHFTDGSLTAVFNLFSSKFSHQMSLGSPEQAKMAVQDSFLCVSKKIGSKVSQHDKSVLSRVFNPNLPNLEDEENNLPSADEPIILNDAEQRAKQLEVEGVKAAEQEDLTKALELFDQAVSTAPNQASGYNNRAQALRLKGDEQGALEDLDKAIQLSQGKGQAASQAYTQRALLKKKRGDDESALEDLKLAAKLGNKFAKSMVIALNPYAAMCNQMLTEMVCKLRQGEPIE